MNKNLFRGVIIGAWIFFFIDFNKWNSMWDVMWSALGCFAVYCTGEIHERGAGLSEPVSPRKAWGASFLVCILIALCRQYLPIHFSQLSPFIVIVTAFCLWKMWPDPKIEDKSKELLVPEEPCHRP